MATQSPHPLDSQFYKTADAFFPAYSNIGLTYDDVTLATQYSEVLPRDTQLHTTLADGLQLNIPSHVVKTRYAKRKVAEALTPRPQVQTITKKELGPDPIAKADEFFNDHPGIHKLLVVDDKDRLHGLFTLSDIERISAERNAQF